MLPLSLGPHIGWVVAAVATAVALSLPVGVMAAALVIPWLVVAGRAFLRHRPSITIGGPSLATGGTAHALAAFYALFAGGALVSSRLGAELFDIGEPLVQLATVHYAFAGTAALVLAAAAHAARPGALGRAAIVLTASAPPVVAVGFLTRSAWPQVGGAVLMTIGVWCTAVLHLREARRPSAPTASRVLLAVSGLAVWVPMVLAVSWAAARFWSVPALSVPDMGRTHGVANAVGFALCGLIARRLGDRPGPGPVSAAVDPGRTTAMVAS